MALAEDLRLDEIPAPLALAPDAEAPDAGQQDRRLSLLKGYEVLAEQEPIASPRRQRHFGSTPHFMRYFRMEKVLVGNQGALKLEEIYESLVDATSPRRLNVAGWAAAEAALVRTDKPEEERLDLLESGVQCWVNALGRQKWLNGVGNTRSVDDDLIHRLAMDIAVAPLMEGLIRGQVDRTLCTAVFQDCLNVAQANVIALELAAKNPKLEGLAGHIGFGYECNAMLALNRLLSDEWFAIPSIARADDGNYNRQQTHDLIVINYENGQIRRMIPVEIKARTSQRDLARYKALIVRGKMHLSMEGRYIPRDTLSIIESVYEGYGTPEQTDEAERLSHKFIEMINDYCAGERLGEFVTKRSIMAFHDNSLVAERHPGLSLAS